MCVYSLFCRTQLVHHAHLMTGLAFSAAVDALQLLDVWCLRLPTSKMLLRSNCFVTSRLTISHSIISPHQEASTNIGQCRAPCHAFSSRTLSNPVSHRYSALQRSLHHVYAQDVLRLQPQNPGDVDHEIKVEKNQVERHLNNDCCASCPSAEKFFKYAHTQQAFRFERYFEFPDTRAGHGRPRGKAAAMPSHHWTTLTAARDSKIRAQVLHSSMDTHTS